MTTSYLNLHNSEDLSFYKGIKFTLHSARKMALSLRFNTSPFLHWLSEHFPSSKHTCRLSTAIDIFLRVNYIRIDWFDSIWISLGPFHLVDTLTRHSMSPHSKEQLGSTRSLEKIFLWFHWGYFQLNCIPEFRFLIAHTNTQE